MEVHNPLRPVEVEPVATVEVEPVATVEVEPVALEQAHPQPIIETVRTQPSIGSYDTPGLNGGRYRGLQQDQHVTGSMNGVTVEQAKTMIDDSMESARRATQGQEAGSTASLAIVTKDNQLVVGQVGDSPIIVYVQDGQTGEITAHNLTKDHSPSNPAEVARVQAEGGFIRNGRVGGGLAITRAFGDEAVGQGVSSEHEVHVTDLNQYMQDPNSRVWVVVASDGMTEKASHQAMSDVFLETSDPAVLSQRLAERAMRNGSTDNISVTVAEIRPGNTQSVVLGVMDGHGTGGENVSRAVHNEIVRTLSESGYVAKNTNVGKGASDVEVIPHINEADVVVEHVLPQKKL